MNPSIRILSFALALSISACGPPEPHYVWGQMLDDCSLFAGTYGGLHKVGYGAPVDTQIAVADHCGARMSQLDASGETIMNGVMWYNEETQKAWLVANSSDQFSGSFYRFDANGERGNLYFGQGDWVEMTRLPSE